MAGKAISFEPGLRRRPEKRFPDRLPRVFTSGDFTGEITMDWREIENEKEKYSAYLCSREWAEKRELVKCRARNTCERCKVLPMDACHHLSYERKYAERLEDLQAICRACHEYTHGKHEFDPMQSKSWLQYLLCCRSEGRNAIGQTITYDYQTSFADGAKLIAIEAICNRFDDIYNAIAGFTESQYPDGNSAKVMHQLEFLAEDVEQLLGLNYAYASWLRFRKPAPPIQWFDHTLALVGVKAVDPAEWPDEESTEGK